MRFRALRFRRAPCSSRSSARSAGRRWRSRLVLATGTALLLLAAARAAGVTNPMPLGGAGLLGVVSGLTRAGGHPADAVLPLIWVLVAVEARRGHARRAGVLVGLSADPRDVEDPRRRCAGPCATAPGSPGRHRGGGRHGSRPVSALPPRRPHSMLSFEWRVTPPSPPSMFLQPLRRSAGHFASRRAQSPSGRARPSPGSCTVPGTRCGSFRSRSSQRGCCSIRSSSRTTSQRRRVRPSRARRPAPPGYSGLDALTRPEQLSE